MKLHVTISQAVWSLAKVILSLQQNYEEIGAINDIIAPFSTHKLFIFIVLKYNILAGAGL